jgi:uncharacterized membrane protein YqgA involved in biofilm formation
MGAILVGGTTGLLAGKKVSEAVRATVMQALALAVFLIGVGGALSAGFVIENGAISTRHTMMVIASLVIGGISGEIINIEKRLENLGNAIQAKLGGKGTRSAGSQGFAPGFVGASLVYCVGAMAIVGSLNDGLSGNYELLFTKAILDGVSAVVFAATLGYGVVFSAFSVGIYQGLITALAALLAPVLTGPVIEQMSVTGSLLIVGISINLLGMAKIKVGNMLPALIIPPLWYGITCLIPALR